MFPAISVSQADLSRVRGLVRRFITSASFFVFPIVTVLAVCAEPLVRTLLTDKWLPSVPFLRLLCLSYAFWPIHTANLQAVSALGRSDIYLKLEVVKKAVGVVSLLLSVPFGVYAMVAMQAVVSLVSTLINAAPTKSLLGYGYKEQWRDLQPALLMSLATGAVVYGAQLLTGSGLVSLIIQLCSGFCFYLLLAAVTRAESLYYMASTIRGSLRSNA